MPLSDFAVVRDHSSKRHLTPLIALLIGLLLLTVCGRRAPVVEAEMTPVAGGMVTPNEAAADDAADDNAAEGVTEAVSAPEAANGLLIGQRVMVKLPDGVTLHADAAGDSLILQRYAVGEALEVLEPSGDYADYPISIDGQEWVRVRAGDGLVGWLPVDAVNSEE